MKLGIDIGRVLIAPDGIGGADTSFICGSIEDALKTPPYDGMFEVVPQLVELFAGQVWLVSKAGPSVQNKTRLWLAHHGFYRKTGIAKQNLRFCRERHQKADHCQQLRISHFIDDRLDVLGHLDGIVAHRYLFGLQKQGIRVPGSVTPVLDWAAALAAVRADIR